MKKINVLKNKLCKCQENKPNVATQLNNIREDLPASKMMAMRLRKIAMMASDDAARDAPISCSQYDGINKKSNNGWPGVKRMAFALETRS